MLAGRTRPQRGCRLSVEGRPLVEVLNEADLRGNSLREHFAEELDALNMSAAELARRLNVPTNRVTEILKGQRAIIGQKSGEPID